MIFRVIQDGLEVWTPAKVNWTLRIHGQRADGFHEIESVQSAISLWDTLRIRALDCEGGIRLRVRDLRATPDAVASDLPEGEENLVVRALQLLRSAAGIRRAVEVELIKRIPQQAGLGGGSSNAAAALLAGNRIWNLRRTHRQLMEMAASLGSDVPFFLGPSPAICRGRGERVVPISLPVRLDIVVVYPPIGLGTADVFNRYREGVGRSASTCAARSGPGVTDDEARRVTWDENEGSVRDRYGVGKRLGNDLQPVAEQLTPWIHRMKSVFARLDVLAHQMSGSGTAYFGICRHAAQAVHIAHRMRGLRIGRVFVATNALGSLSA